MKMFLQLIVFIGILFVLKYFLGLPISIVGSVALTVVLTALFSAFSSRR